MIPEIILKKIRKKIKKKETIKTIKAVSRSDWIKVEKYSINRMLKYPYWLTVSIKRLFPTNEEYAGPKYQL